MDCVMRFCDIMTFDFNTENKNKNFIDTGIDQFT